MTAVRSNRSRPRGMAKRKGPGQNGFATSSNSVQVAPRKTAMVLGDSESEDDSNSQAGGVSLKENGDNSTEDHGFKINTDYAARFLHNKKREELHRLEEKYGQNANGKKRKSGAMDGDEEDHDSDDSSSTDEDEDDEGILATSQLDDEISATLQAIRSKDPRLYQSDVTFYSKFDDDDDAEGETTKKTKPIYLRDYHREQLLKGQVPGEDVDEEAPVQTYAQEQDNLQKEVIQSMHKAADSDGDVQDSSDSDGGFIVPKKSLDSAQKSVQSSKSSRKEGKVEVDISEADKNPETFLSNFMAARAWVPNDSSRFQPFQSDDEEDDEKADAFENAYNLRFEDPRASNEKLVSHARSMAAKLSVRREEKTGRKKARTSQKSKKELDREEREEEKARLRKLKIEETEEKIKKIKEAAGLRGATIDESDWTRFLDDGWDDSRWTEEMDKRFGESYYRDEDVPAADDEQGETAKKRKLKKPKWEDDIDIADLVPDFVAEDEANPQFDISDHDNADINGTGDSTMNKSSKKKKDHKQERQDQKREARKQRKKVEDFVDERLDFDVALTSSSTSKTPSKFQYRETSPVAYGLTSRDILLASDSQLNQFAGLKKLAAFRDEEKKRKDRKNLSKKARLRQWRKDTFGDENGPVLQGADTGESSRNTDGVLKGGATDVSDTQPKSKKRRRRTKKEADSPPVPS